MMSVSPTDFLEFSEGHLISHQAEIGFRTVISRAYYAAFHHAEPVATALPAAHSLPPGTHELRISMFTKNPNAEIKAVGYMMDGMRRCRVIADYKLSETVSFENAEQNIETAKKIIAKLDSLKVSLNLSQAE